MLHSYILNNDFSFLFYRTKNINFVQYWNKNKDFLLNLNLYNDSDVQRLNFNVLFQSKV